MKTIITFFMCVGCAYTAYHLYPATNYYIFLCLAGFMLGWGLADLFKLIRGKRKRTKENVDSISQIEQSFIDGNTAEVSFTWQNNIILNFNSETGNISNYTGPGSNKNMLKCKSIYCYSLTNQIRITFRDGSILEFWHVTNVVRIPK